MARWIFVEVWILSSFLVDPALVNRFGDRVFKVIQRDEEESHLHLAIAGGGTFGEMSTSLLARFDCREIGGKTTRDGSKHVISPRLHRKVTPDTKDLVQEEEAKMLQSLNPSTRHFDRVSPRGKRHFIPVIAILSTGFDSTYVEDDALIGEIAEATAEKELNGGYATTLASVHMRLWKKGQNVQTTVKSGNGGRVIAEFRRAQSLIGIEWRPGVLMFCSSGTTPNYASLASEKFTMGNIVELFILVKVASNCRSVSDLAEICSIDIVCKSGSGSGSFTGARFVAHSPNRC
jgi:hypothetical protein